MESTDTYRAITEAPHDWESGDAPIPAARQGYTRQSPQAELDPTFEDEANSDLGNQGRELRDAELASAPAR